MKIYLAQQNYHIGNFESNTAKIIDGIRKAKAEKADLVLFSELCICGYPPRDFLEFDDFINQCYAAIDKVKEFADDIGVVIGSPARNPLKEGKELFNAAFLLYQKEIKAEIHKTLLPTYDVFDENRYFEPAIEWKCIEFKGRKLAVTICEDIWNLGDTTINGRKFTRISPSAIFDQGLLYTCESGDYRIYQRVPNLGISIDSFVQAAGLPPGTVTIPSHLQTTILKSGASAGATWSDTVFKFTPFPFFDVIAKLDFKLEQKGIQRTVLGKVYTNVIHVSSKLNVVIPLTPFPADIRVNYYFADNIGLIETSTANNGTLQSLTRLYRYKIK